MGCHNGWRAPDCTEKCSAATTCNGHGTCGSDGKCICDHGFQGTDCSTPGYCEAPATPTPTANDDCPESLKHMVGEGTCDDDVNIPECNYDGGDCCGPNKVCFSEYSDCECKEDVDSQNTVTNTVDSQETDTDPNYI